MADTSLQQNVNCAYVYEIIVDGVVRYIGKGTGRRAAQHMRIAETVNRRRAAGEAVRTTQFYNRLAKAIRLGSAIEHRIVASSLSDGDAFMREITEIAAAPHGQLWNKYAGGSGITSDDAKRLWLAPDFRERMMLALSDPKVRQKISDATKARWQVPGARERYGRAVSIGQLASDKFKAARSSPKFIENCSKAQQAAWRDAEGRRQRQREMALAREANPEFKRRQSEAARARWADPVHRERHAAARAADPDRSQRTSKSVKARWADPEFRARYRISAKAAWVKRRLKAKSAC